jgi:Rieske Fe-S protein
MSDELSFDRRTVLRAVGAAGALVATGAALSACALSGASETGSAADSSNATVPTTRVPVGGGIIVLSGAGGVVVVQPSAGVFRAFSAICPHAGCTVDSIDGSTITCPCHGSQFNLADGAVVRGPAQSGLTALTATVKGADVVVS